MLTAGTNWTVSLIVIPVSRRSDHQLHHVAPVSRNVAKTVTGAFAKVPERQPAMSKALAAILGCGYFFAATFALAADQPDRAAAKQATATCRAEVKERAKYNEMSLWAQHKAVKKCVTEALAKH
jgi:hypothetical protein